MNVERPEEIGRPDIPRVNRLANTVTAIAGAGLARGGLEIEKNLGNINPAYLTPEAQIIGDVLAGIVVADALLNARETRHPNIVPWLTLVGAAGSYLAPGVIIEMINNSQKISDIHAFQAVVLTTAALAVLPAIRRIIIGAHRESNRHNRENPVAPVLSSELPQRYQNDLDFLTNNDRECIDKKAKKNERISVKSIHVIEKVSLEGKKRVRLAQSPSPSLGRSVIHSLERMQEVEKQKKANKG